LRKKRETYDSSGKGGNRSSERVKGGGGATGEREGALWQRVSGSKRNPGLAWDRKEEGGASLQKNEGGERTNKERGDKKCVGYPGGKRGGHSFSEMVSKRFPGRGRYLREGKREIERKKKKVGEKKKRTLNSNLDDSNKK